MPDEKPFDINDIIESDKRKQAGEEQLKEVVGDTEDLPKAPEHSEAEGPDTLTDAEIEALRKDGQIAEEKEHTPPQTSGSDSPSSKTEQPPEDTRIEVETLLNRYDYDDIGELIDRYRNAGAVPALCSHGCMVEPDGECPHGHPSIYKEVNVI